MSLLNSDVSSFAFYKNESKVLSLFLFICTFTFEDLDKQKRYYFYKCYLNWFLDILIEYDKPSSKKATTNMMVGK